VASKRKAKPKAKRPVGRPRTEMTDENIAAILRTVALGVWPDRAAQMHGVSADAMRMHKMRHPEFVTSLEKAEAQAESGYLSKILRHTEKQWTAAAWMLERRWGERWAQRQKIEHSGNPDSPVVVEQVGPSVPHTTDLLKGIDQLRALAQEHFGEK
jgi:hypothetical protein